MRKWLQDRPFKCLEEFFNLTKMLNFVESHGEASRPYFVKNLMSKNVSNKYVNRYILLYCIANEILNSNVAPCKDILQNLR